MALFALSLPLSERFVLRVFCHGAACCNILPYLKFFDWVGCLPRFHHTRPTFVAIFHILSHARLKPLLLDFLYTFRRRLFHHRPYNALYAFAHMRFLDLDLDAFTYHVLLDSLIDQNYSTPSTSSSTKFVVVASRPILPMSSSSSICAKSRGRRRPMSISATWCVMGINYKALR
ncbi:hypothetical protein Fmac_014853 [Flemingia macrophylla]|uniref:Uncharacterized protein n=1 Tax=Flemingia macrophylla TaxID=520843 RepID=A0ABD1MCW5_9FABA